MERKLILFDIDKTLIDDLKINDDPWRLAFKSVYGINCPITLSQKTSHGMTMKEIAIETIKNKGLEEEIILKRLNLFIKTLEKFYKKSLENGKISLFPKIPELLRTLSNEKHILGLVTGNTRIIAFAKLKKAGIDKFFKIGGFGDDSTNREELIKIAIKRARQKYSFRFGKKNVFVIGDTPKDISAAMKFKIQTIGVATGIYSKQKLSKTGATFVLNDLQNIKKVLLMIR